MGLFYRLSVWIRSNFFIPDARALWIAPSVNFLIKYLETHHIDAIFSDGPPHTNTRIASLIKQKTGIPWLSDYQDPWSQVDYFKALKLTPWGLKKHLKQEQDAFKNSDKITIVSPTWKKDIEEIGAQNVDVVYWGYDPDDYTEVKIDHEISKKFSMIHAGVMGFDRNPGILFEVIGELALENKVFRNTFQLHLYGQIDQSVKQSIINHKIEPLVKFKGNVNRQEAINGIFSAQVLLLLLNQQPNAKGRVPGKLFEYLASHRPILNLGPDNSDVSSILSTANAGVSLEYSDKESIKSYLLKTFNHYTTGQLSIPVNSSIEKYTLQRITGKIAMYLDEITN